MKKIFLIAAAGLLTTASIVAANRYTGKKPVTKEARCTHHCHSMDRTHCF